MWGKGVVNAICSKSPLYGENIKEIAKNVAKCACFWNIRPYDLNMRKYEYTDLVGKMVLFCSQSVIFTSYDVMMT